VDVILPIYGEWNLAAQALAALPEAAAGMTEPYRVLVVDNASPPLPKADGGETKPAELAEGIRSLLRRGDGLFRLDQNKGYPGAANYGASRGNAPLILMLTSDVVLQPAALHHMVKEMDEKEVGVVGLKLLFPTKDSPHGPAGSVQHAGLAFDIRGKPFHIFIGWRPDNPRVNQRREMSAVTGACFLTRRSLWTQIGGFWEGYGRGTFEDVEYCFSVRRAGAKVLYCPLAVGYHLVSGSRLAGANQAGFALPINESHWRGRCHDMLAWDEFRYW
jgi:GT2 family glycosyltransferase